MKKPVSALILISLVGMASFLTWRANQGHLPWSIGEDHRIGVPLPAKGESQKNQYIREMWGPSEAAPDTDR